ncbi:ketopantoate reductase family protein [Hungatella hathewayi]|uniref:ketopantoate reductase family protein n=1 Tax=Hungatella hathewayi TaxID=154046 RepID=UPI0003367BAC|nr:ketopantoate reductase family protein [Hungatella hathewayi]CCZ61024.1 2-dehydropantoate 2-reductase [Hungatella hathewayi CAG:224]
MKIAVIGAGAMGSIYGGHLSKNHQVYLVDTNPDIVKQINSEGLKIDEDGVTNIWHPTAVTDTEGLGEMDLVILFVKSIFSRAALAGNRGVIGEKTRLLTLQNGAGHEDILKEFVPEERVIIGTTEDNGAVLAPGHVRRGGIGNTNVGMLTEDREGFLPRLKEAFDSCGFHVKIHENIQYLIWDKLFTNVSLSAVTGILQVDMGFIAGNEYAWNLTKALIHEATAVAGALGLSFDEETVTERVRQTSIGNPTGCTSIRADLRDGRRTEVNTISGAVVTAAKRCGVPVPSHEFVVNMVHAMEMKRQDSSI